MFKGLIAAIEHVARNIACLESTMNDVRELLIEKKQRDGRRNRKQHAEESKLYADGMADHDSFSTTDGFGKTVQPKPEA